MKKILLILLILMTSVTAAETFTFDNEIEAEVEGLNSEFSIEEIDDSMERPIYQAFRVESDGFTRAELRFSMPPSWLDANGFELFRAGLIEEDTKLHRVSGNFEDYRVNISAPAYNYFFARYSPVFLF